MLYMLLGNVYSIEQNWKKAEETLQMAIEYLSPRDREEPTWIYSDLAGVYAKQGLYDKALETMKLASKSKFHNSAVEYNYGEIYRAMGDFETAISYYQRSLKIYRDNVSALAKLGLCYQQLNKFELSNKAFLNALNLVPNDPEILNNIGFNYSRMGDSSKALHYFEATLNKSPDYARAQANYGMELIKLKKNLPEAAERLQKAIRLDPQMTEPRLALSALIVKKAPDKSLALLQEAYKINPENIKTNLYFGLYYLEVKDQEKAKAWFQRALKLDPDNKPALSLLSSLK